MSQEWTYIQFAICLHFEKLLYGLSNQFSAISFSKIKLLVLSSKVAIKSIFTTLEDNYYFIDVILITVANISCIYSKESKNKLILLPKESTGKYIFTLSYQTKAFLFNQMVV